MMDKTDQRRLMLQYLFGELPADECAQFEDTYLKNSDVFHELVALENEIVDQYVLGELSGIERERFESSLLRYQARREAVETARSLLAYSTGAENESLSHKSRPVQAERRAPGKYRTWGIQVAAAIVFLAMIGGVLWLIVNNRRLGNELARLQQERAITAQDKQMLQRRIDGLQADLQQRDIILQRLAQLPSHDTVSFTVGPGISRGGDASKTLVIPARTSYVVFHIDIGDDAHSRYSVSIRTADDRLLWHKGNIQGRRAKGHQEIAVILSPTFLQSGDYVIRVSAGKDNSLTDVAGYSFNVVRR